MTMTKEALNSLNQIVEITSLDGSKVTYTIREIAEINQGIGMVRALKGVLLIGLIGIGINAARKYFKKLEEANRKEAKA